MNKFHAITAFLLFTAVLAWGDEYEWTGAIGNDWDKPCNWSNITSIPTVSNGFPGYDVGTSAHSDDTAIFPSTATVSLPSLIAAGNFGEVTIQLGASVTVTLKDSASGGSKLNLSLKAEWLTIKGELTFYGAFQVVLNGGSKSLSIASTGGDFTLDGSGAKIESGGPITITAAGNITINGPVTGGGVVDVKAAGAIAINGAIAATGNTVALITTAGGISGAGAITGTTLTIDAVGAVNLSGASHAGALNVTNSGGFLFKNGEALTISGIASNGAVGVEAAGAITINGAVTNTGTGVAGNIGLTATVGGISQSGTGVISGTELTVQSAGLADLSTLTNTTTAVKVTGSAGFRFKNKGALGITGITSSGAVGVEATAITINGAIAASGNTVALTTTTAGGISQSGTAPVTATDLRVIAAGNVAMAVADNAVDTLVATGPGGSAVSGNVSFRNGQDLSIGISGEGLKAAGTVAVTTVLSGGITVTEAVTGDAGVTIDSGGALSASAGISSTDAPIVLTADSMTVGESASPVNAGNGTVTIKNKTGNKTIALMNSGSEDINVGTTITARTLEVGSKSAPVSGSITVGGNYAAIQTIVLKTGAGINEAGTPLTGQALTIDAVGAVNMNGSVHAVNVLQVTTGAGFLFKNGGALTISGITSGGAVDVEAAGAITINGPVTSGDAVDVEAAAITINDAVTATGNTIHLTTTTGVISGTGAITGTTLTIDAVGAVNLSGASHAGALNVTNSGGFLFKNGEALTISGIASNGAVGVEAAGAITINGAVTNTGTGVAGNIGLTTTVGGISQSGTGVISGTELTVQSAGLADLSTLTNTTTAVKVTGSARFRFKNKGALGITGITSSGAVGVEATGNITISGAVTGNTGVTIDSGGILSASAGISSPNTSITLIADYMTVGDAASVNAGNGTVTIENKSLDKTIALNYGAADIRIGTNIIAGTLTIGSKSAPASGTITASGNYAAMPIITLQTGAGIIDGGMLTAATLAIDADGAVNMSGFVHAVNVLQVTNSAGFLFKNDRALAISGITSGGAVDVEAAGNITINGSVTSGGVMNVEAAAITINDAVTATGNTIHLTTTTGGISGTGTLMAATLAIDATGAVNLDGSVHAVNVLQVTNSAGFLFKNGRALDISGITSSGVVDVEAAGAITINGPVTSGGAVNVEAEGNITISGPVTGVAGVTIDSGGTLNASAGISSIDAPIALTADFMTVGELAACLVNAETGTVTIKSKTDNKTIALDYGHADIRIGTNITAGSLDIGSKSAPASGSITVGGNYASMPIIILKTGAGINDAGTLAGKALTIDAVGAVNMSRFVHAVNLLQIAAGAGFLFKNDGALAISGITSGGAVNVEAAGAITISDSATINGAFNLKGTLLAIGNNDPGGAQTELAASSMMFDAPLVTGNITFDGNLAFSQSLVELTGHIINRKTISAASAQKLYFNGNYTGLDGALLKGTNGTTEIHFRKDAEFAVSPVSGHEDNGSWLVFSGTETQQFNSGGHVLGNVRIQKGGGELRLEGSDVIQRGNATLMIEEGLLHLAHESGPGGTIQMGWTMGIPDTAGQARGGNFFALGGTLSFANNSGIGAELRAMDIVLGENAALSASGAGNNTMAAMGNIDIAGNTAGNKNFGNSSLVMIPGSGAERTQIASETDLFRLVVLRPAELVGDITLTEMQLGSPAYAQINSVSVAYADSISLDGGSSVIRVLGNWINHCVDTNSDGITRTFVYGTGKVIFDRTSNSDKVIAIRGGTAWHTFICESPGAIIQFDNYPSRHYVAHKLTVKGAAGADGSIALTRLLDAGQPDRKPPDTSQPLLPLTEEDHKRYWDLVLQPSADGLGGTTMELENVMITYSNSNLRVPIPSRDKGVLAYPFYNRNNPSPPAAYPGSDYGSYSYYNINWVIRYSFIYAFTEDANGNGRIDRIRAQSAYELNSGEGGAFDKISIRVAKNDAADEEWIKVKGYGMTPGHPDSIYIYLEEHDYADGGAKDLAIHIEANESLMDLATGLSPVTNPVDDPLLTIDTAFPRITYALMLPSSNKAFVQFSEDIDDALMKFVYPDNQSPVEVARVGTGRKNEFELGFAGTGYDASVLASGPLFSVTGIKDIAVHARDKNEDDPDFPSPKYPVDWKYSDYAVVPGNPPSPAAGNVLIPPNALPGTILFHRVTDFLVSDYPRDYFAMPVWAMNPQENVGPNQGAHVARVFNGSDYLEDKDIALEINVNPALVGYTPEMLFSSAVPEAYRAGSSPVDPDFGVDHGITGLWLPPFASLGYDADATPPENARAFSNMVAEPYQSAYVVSALNASSNGNFNFKLEKNAAAYSYAAVSTLEFFLRLIPPVANPDFEYLCVGRLGKGSPWYRHIEPFKFELHNVTRQRGGVTILNNVIKPSTGEQVYVDYTLPRSGPVTVQVFTLDGNLVKTLSREHKAAGEYRSGWDGKNNGGREVARGMYFIRVVAPDIDEIRKVMVVK